MLGIMQVLVSLETRFERTPDGRVWTQTMNAYPFWSRYLEVFDQVRVLARVREVPATSPDWQRADGEGVAFAAVPYYVGLGQFLWKSREIRGTVRKAFRIGEAAIFRVSSVLADIIQRKLSRIGYPYGVEVVGDPYDVFSPGAFRHPLRPLLRWWAARRLRDQCRRACAAAYVTAQALQRRYPCPAYAVGVSDVEITDDALVPVPRTPRPDAGPFKLISVGSLDHFYKGPDVLIDAVATCLQRGLKLELAFVGDGRHRGELAGRAAAHGIAGQVRFLGQLTAGAAVRTQLDKADIFVLPSRQEGLPRALVEAMARALPCIGSSVGGIPELLPGEDLVPPGDVAALAGKIQEVAADKERLAIMAARNLEKARNYHDAFLRDKRLAFYKFVKGKTEEWLHAQGPA